MSASDPVPPALPPRRRRLAQLLVLGASLVLSLLLAELTLRAVRPQEAMSVDRGLYEPDPPRRYRLHPGYRGRITNHVEFDDAVAVNSHGMRGPEPTNAAVRVLALGDSFTFGVGAREDETYPARLQAHLREAGLDAVVWNAGVPGYGVPDEVAWYERWGVPLKPNMVVIAPFLANDLQDAMPGSPTRVVDGELVAGDGNGGARRWLYYHSHLFRLVKSSLLEGPLRQKLGLAEPWARRERRFELALYGRDLPPELAPGAVATQHAVARLIERGLAEKAGVLAVLVPSLPQVDPRRWRALHADLGVDLRGQDPRRTNRFFTATFEGAGVPVVDATDALAAETARGERVYYARDQHLTPLGYDLLAREVARAILRLGRKTCSTPSCS
ncbi:MAG TPA: GDSL-type esterase/lipase family protein [Thermoanaerobaculia bacterium]|nr:GDSL-type esterase/lipase family protein [Thermoanaerobaculia bacterium]